MSVTATELAQIQADAVAAVCDKTCIIQRVPSSTQDIYGSASKTSYTTVTTTVAGMAEPTAGQLANYAYRIESLAAWQVHLPVGTDVRAQDWLLIDNQVLEVHVLLTPRSYEALRTVIAAELKP